VPHNFQGQMGGYQNQGPVQMAQPGQFWWMICKKYILNGRRWYYWDNVGETAVYVVLAILIIAFLFFVINTIRCYMNKPKYVDDDDDYM
jgi:hypothetical protein